MYRAMQKSHNHVVQLTIVFFLYPVDHVGEQAWSARRPYQASQLPSHKLPLRKVAKVALIFCFLVSKKKTFS